MIILLFQVMALHLGAIQNADILSTVRVTELERLMHSLSGLYYEYQCVNF